MDFVRFFEVAVAQNNEPFQCKQFFGRQATRRRHLFPDLRGPEHGMFATFLLASFESFPAFPPRRRQVEQFE